MIDVSKLPDFASGEVSTFNIDINFENLAQCLPESHPLVWLESHQNGQRLLFVDAIWSIEVYVDCIKLTLGSDLTFIALEERLDYKKVLNSLERDWLTRQPPEFKMPWILSYEAGWNGESRRQTKEDSPLPEFWCCCPKILITQKIGELQATVLQAKQWPDFKLTPCRAIHASYAKEVVLIAEESKQDYLNKINQVKQHIRQGDSFQVNLSQGFQALGHIDLYSWAHYAFKQQASSFGALVRTEAFSLLSLSPERLLARKGENLITRPIAGTLPKNAQETQQHLNDFKSHPKELAEHNMLIDLERNDLGKICKPGSVVVDEYLSIETLPHVHHLVSQVIGKKEPDAKFGDVIFALFPGGTITGCPKLETMHIIDKLEKKWRSFYTGSLGYLGQGHFDSNILIRTAINIDAQTYMRFGGGLVWDSDPEKEYLETLAKAKGLIHSLLDGGADFDSDHRSLRQFFT